MLVSFVYLSPDRVLDDDMDSLAAVSVYQESDTENQERILNNSILYLKMIDSMISRNTLCTL